MTCLANSNSPQCLQLSVGLNEQANLCCLGRSLSMSNARAGIHVLAITKNTNLRKCRFRVSNSIQIQKRSPPYYAGVGNQVRPMSAVHRFPPPWSIKEEDGRFVVRDRNGRAFKYVYFKDQHGRRSVGTVFTRDEARHIAASVAELPAVLA
jgi:hypothetical protein